MPTEITPWTLILDQGAGNANATMPAIAAGSSRLVLMAVVMYSGSTTVQTPPSLTANSVVANRYAGVPTETERTAAAFYVFTESQIAAISGQTITSSGSGTQKSILYKLLGDCDQIPSWAQNSAYANAGTMPTMPLTRAASSITEALAFCDLVDAVLTMSDPARDTTVVLGTGRRVSVGYEADTARTADFTVVRNSRTAAVVINIAQASAQTITSINDDDEINAGAVNTAEVVGYVVGVNPIVSGTVGSLALTGVSQVGSEVFFTPPAPTNAAYWPEPDGTETLTLTDGAAPSTFNAPFRPLAGYTSVVVASPDNADEYKLGYWATTPPVDGDRIMADFTVNPDTSFEGATDGLHIWYHWVSATSTMYIYEATIGGGVIVDNRSLTSPGLVSRGLVTRGLVARGL